MWRVYNQSNFNTFSGSSTVTCRQTDRQTDGQGEANRCISETFAVVFLVDYFMTLSVLQTMSC
jgi:hypothetical protein